MVEGDKQLSPVAERAPLGPVGTGFAWAGRTARYRWWRPLLALPVIVLVFLPTLLVPLVTRPWSGPALEVGQTLFVISCLIPAIWVGVALVERRPMGSVSSVVGIPRFAWMALVIPPAIVYLLVMVITLGILGVLAEGSLPTPTEELTPPDPASLAPLLLAILVLTPFQAAAEEYLCRGWLFQTVAGWFGDRAAAPREDRGAGVLTALAMLVAGLVSSLVFAFLHGAQNIWLFSDRFLLGAVLCVVAVRTGGLEAGITLHAVNNTILFLIGAFSGQLDNGLRTEGTMSAPWWFTVTKFVLIAIFATGVIGLANLLRIARTVGDPRAPLDLLGRVRRPRWPSMPPAPPGAACQQGHGQRGDAHLDGYLPQQPDLPPLRHIGTQQGGQDPDQHR